LAGPNRIGILTFKWAAVAIGIALITLSSGYLMNELNYLGSVTSVDFTDVVAMVGILSVSLSGMALVAAIPRAARIRLEKIRQLPKVKPSYGFGSLLAVGLGATLGSPLFIIIPLNILQYEAVSLGSLAIATVLSILMAKVYANMYTQSVKEKLDAVGGPSFTKVACGTRSVRYFISRLSMWIANTALAAYSKIVFVVFDFELMPGVLAAFGIAGVLSDLIVWLITAIFVGWTVLNALFEQRILKLIGYVQIMLTVILIAILGYQSVLLGDLGSWNISGAFSHYTGSGNWLLALLVNTGFLYILFFGFQEIQALERDAHDLSSVPIVSWVKKGFKLPKDKYLGIVMILSVAIAAAINILYALAVYSIHPSLTILEKQQIPAIFLASNYLGPTQELLIAIAFLIATITTFVPAFLAASRHLGALAEDGFMPHSVSRLSYIFTLIAILILAFGDENFLINITDFLVLISLGFITLSAIWLKKGTAFSFRRENVLPLIVGLSCFAAGASVYIISQPVVIFGAIFIAATYLIYDIYELGPLGSKLFLGLFDVMAYAALRLYPHTYSGQSFFLFSWLNISTSGTGLLSYSLIVCSVLLFSNVAIEMYLRDKPRAMEIEKSVPVF
jgi:amino acid transporter